MSNDYQKIAFHSVAMDSKRPMMKVFYRELISSLKGLSKKDVQGQLQPSAPAPTESTLIIDDVAPNTDPYKVWRVRQRKMTPQEIRGMIGENCGLIKTVDKDLIPGIERRIKRIYEGTSTPTTLARYLENECDLEPWQAQRIISDQLNKYDSAVRLASFKKAGVKLVRWVPGDSKEPRPWHCKHWPHGLAGGVFSIDNPPIIDPATGERGWPGQLVNCRCRLEAVR